ncbi:MAG: AI-2E family transporter [Candidatus Acidiferrales bacterium]
MRPSYNNPNASGVLLAIAVIGALYLGRIVFIPLALAILFSILLSPVIAFLERIHLPRFLAIFLVVLTLLGGAGAAGWKLSQQFGDLTDQLPTYKKTLEDKIHILRGMRSESLTKATSTVQELEKEMAAANPVPGTTDGTRRNAAPGSTPSKPLAVQVVPPTNPLESLENMLGPITTAFVVAVFTVFILMGREDLRNRIVRLAGGGRLNAITQALDDATHRIDQYLLLQLVVNTCYGAAIAVALHFLGIPHASIWGIGAGVLRFLPYLGPPLAAVIPILLSLAVFPGWEHTFATMGVFFCLEVTVANFIEPYLYGAHVGLSPLAILVAAIFWTLIWGFPGLVLSTPITVCLVVMGRYLPGLRFFNILLGDEQTLAPDVEYYQRLLAADEDDARRILERCRKNQPLVELYSSVVIPALSLAEHDRHRNELDQPTQDFVYQSTREIVEELGDSEPRVRRIEGLAPVRDLRVHSRDESESCEVLCVPARDEADAVVALLLAQLLEQQGTNCQSFEVDEPETIVRKAAEAEPNVLLISALPPFAIESARSLYAKLRAQLPGARIIVGFWHFEGDADRIRKRLRLAEGDSVVTTLSAALEHIAADDGEKSLPHAKADSTAQDEQVQVDAAVRPNIPSS